MSFSVGQLGRGIAPGDVLFDIACSPTIRTVVQGIFSGVRLRAVDIEELSAIDMSSLNAAHAIVFGIRDQRGAPTLDLIQRVRSIAPHVGLFVVEEQSTAIDPWLRRLASCGADDAFALDRPCDEGALRSALINRVAVPPPEQALRKLWLWWAECPVRLEATHCVRNAYRARYGFATHEWFGLKDRVMRDRFRRARIPSPFFLTRLGLNLHWREGLAGGRSGRAALATNLGFDTVAQFGKDRRRVRRRADRWPELGALLG